jgi:hypothetical protein
MTAFPVVIARPDRREFVELDRAVGAARSSSGGAAAVADSDQLDHVAPAEPRWSLWADLES